MIDDQVRAIAREEIASLAGLVLRRLQEEHPTRSFERNMADDAVVARLNGIFGEVLADFGGTPDEPEEDA